jgi:iron complex outermembrane receptor protein
VTAILPLLAMLCASFSHAQEPPETDVLAKLSLEELAQTEITSVTKEAVTAFRTPAAVTVISGADIRRSGARTIPDLLRLIPGVNVGQIQSNEWAVGIRGFEGRLSKAMLVLIDGRSVYTPLFAGVYWEMHDVPLEDIARIEVIRGPGGTVWGSNAVNGVVNIITKNSRDTHGTFVTVGTGTVRRGFLEWRYGAGDDSLSYRVYARGFDRGPQYHRDNGDFDDWRHGQTGFRVDWQRTDREALTVQGDAYAAEAGQQLRLNFFSPPSNPIVEGDKRFNGQNIMATWRRVLSSSDFQLRTYWDRTNREELNYKEIRNTFDADFIHRMPLGRHEMTWGLGARFSPSTFFQKLEAVNFLPHKQTYRIFSAFVQDDIALRPDKLSLTVGTKLETTSYSGFNYQPSARLAWTPDSENTFWGAVTRAVRTASRLEEGFNFSALLAPATPLYVRLIGDGNFEPEELIAYEAGFRHYISARGFVSVSLFHNRYDDLLSVEQRPTFVETTPSPAHVVLPLDFRNGIVAHSTGGELTVLWDFTESIRTRASYSLVRLDAERKHSSIDASTVNQLEGDTPHHKVIVQSTFELPLGFELNGVYRYVSSVRNQAAPSYSTADAWIGRRLGAHFSLEIVGRNLLQPFHVEYGGLPGPQVGIRRSGFVALTWTP